MTPEAAVALVGTLVVAFGAFLTWLGTRGKTKADQKTALDQRIDERVKSELERVYKRLDDVERTQTRKMSAFARILRAIAAQWPDPHGPDLDPADIAEIEETVPPGWIRRPKPTN